MSADPPKSESGRASASANDPDRRLELATEVEILREENEKLRSEYARVRRIRNRNAAFGLAVVGFIALIAAIVLPAVRTLLIVLGATGLFTAVLVYYLSPTRVIPATIGESVYDALEANEATLVSELGLDAPPTYVPSESDDATTPSVVLFVSQEANDGAIPTDINSLFVISSEESGHGVVLHPTGEPLLEELRRSMSDDLGSTPDELTGQLSDAIEAFGMVDAVTYTINTENDRLTIGVSGQSYGDPNRFDHPIVSFFAVGLASGLREPVRVEEIEPADQVDAVIEYRWGS